MHLLRSPVPSEEINIRDIICLIKVFERGRLISYPLADVITTDQICVLKLNVLSNRLIRRKSNYVLMEISAYIEIYSFKM